MAIRVMNLKTQRTFVWSEDPDKGTEDETKFLYRPLDAYELAYLQDRITSIDNMPDFKPGDDPNEIMAKMGMRTEIHKIAIDAVRMACIGTENLQDEEGLPVAFATVSENIGGKTKLVMAPDLLRGLPIGMMLAFYMEIMSNNRVTVQQRKNSELA